MHAHKDHDPRPWPVKTVDVPVAGDIITLELVACFDDVLDDMADRHPDDTDQIPYFADLWPSALALANHLVSCYPDLRGKSLLELGCGTGLPSIAAARRGASVTATDFHPQNQPYFEANARRNGVAQILYKTMDWCQPPEGMTYDLVIGSDLLYEARQIDSLSTGIVQRLAPGGTAILADPGRKHIQQAADTLEKMGLHVRLDIQDETFMLTLRHADGTRSCR